MAAIQALTAFGENGFADEAAAEIAKVLARRNPQIVQTACAALGSLGKAAVPSLMVALQSTNADVRTAAANALGRVGQDAGQALPALIEVASHQSIAAARRAATGNAMLQAQARARAKRAPATNNTSDQAAANALGRIGIGDDDQLREIMELFEDSTPAVRSALVAGFYGNRLKRGDIQFLIAASDDEDESLRAQAAAALVCGAADDENVKYVIEQMIHNDTNNVRDQIVNTLIDSPQLTGAAPLLVACLGSRDIQTRFARQMPALIQAIGREGPAAVAAVDALIELIDVDAMEGRADMIAAAIDALGNIGPPASKAIAALTAWTDAKDQQFGNGDRLSRHAERALRKIAQGGRLRERVTEKKAERE
ncbi:MAG TPA: HEAT repeat domain-containing protein [Pirellulales bacterium]